MEKYKQRSPVASVADKLLRALVAAALGIAWFVWLWGLCLPAITAGVAMGALLWLCARLFGKKSVQKRELQMRRMIGGELAVEKLILMEPRPAAFQAAVWLTTKEPIAMQKAVDWGVVGTVGDESVFVRLIAQHKSVPINVQQVIEVVKEARTRQAQRCYLLLTSSLMREAAAYAETASPEIVLIKREELIRLAGLCSPATDEDLMELGNRNRQRKRRTAKEWGRLVLDATRTRRYFWYGIGLMLLALLTKQWVYPFPAAVCLALFAACKARQWHIKRG